MSSNPFLKLGQKVGDTKDDLKWGSMDTDRPFKVQCVYCVNQLYNKTTMFINSFPQ